MDHGPIVFIVCGSYRDAKEPTGIIMVFLCVWAILNQTFENYYYCGWVSPMLVVIICIPWPIHGKLLHIQSSFELIVYFLYKDAIRSILYIYSYDIYLFSGLNNSFMLERTVGKYSVNHLWVSGYELKSGMIHSVVKVSNAMWYF